MKIREASINDAEEIAAVHVESWKTTYTGIIPESYLAALSVLSRAKNWVQVFENQRADEIVYVAEDLSGKIVGFAHGGPNRNEEYQYNGELYALYVLQEHQQLGFGKLLFNSMTRHLKSNGCTSMMLWVLRDNPALAFYTRQGGRQIGQKNIVIRTNDLVEFAMGWNFAADTV